MQEPVSSNAFCFIEIRSFQQNCTFSTKHGNSYTQFVPYKTISNHKTPFVQSKPGIKPKPFQNHPTFATQNVDYVVMSGTYNLIESKNIKIWENYIIENLKSNWNYAKKALIEMIVCLTGY